MKKLRYIAVLLLIVSLVLTPFTHASAVSAEAEEEEVVRIGEVESLRETNSETYLMSDGTYECVVYAENKYYRNANDVLLPIDNAIVAASGGANLLSTQYTNTANAFDVTFSGSGTPEISISYGDAGITFTPVDATGSGNMHMTASASAIAIGAVQNCSTLNELTATGSNTATYADAFGTADLVYVLDSDALKEYIVLEDSAAPNSFNFLFTLDGVTLQETDSGATFLNAAGGEVFNLGSLYAVDANGVPTDDLTYTFQTVKDNIIGVTVTLDPEYLAAADRAFPVVIDPTIMISSSSTPDACVCSYTPSTNFQTAAQLRTGFCTDYGIRRSYIKFEIPSSVPSGSVTSARMDIEKLSGVAPTVKAYRVTSSWSSGSITWNNKPAYSTAYASSTSSVLSSGSSWYIMDVTSTVQHWVNGTYTNYGFVLIDNVESDSSHWTTIYSSDANSPHKPELYITYTDTVIPEPEPDPTQSLSLNYSSLDLDIGSSRTITATTVPSNANVDWSSSDPSIVSVVDGVVTALKPGIVTITAMTSFASEVCSVYATVADGTYYIRNTGAKKFVDGSNNPEMQQQEFVGTSPQKWSITHIGQGAYSICRYGTTTYLAASDDNTANGQEVVLRTGTLTNGMKWRIESAGSGVYKLKPLTGVTNNSVMAVEPNWLGNISANGNGFTLQTYGSSSDGRDTWELIGNFDSTFVAIPETGKDRTASFSSVNSSLRTLGYYSNRQISEVDPGLTGALMATSDIFYSRSHGMQDSIQVSNSQLFSIYLMDTYPVGVFSCDLVFYGACYTGQGGSSANNLVKKTVEKGATTAVGFTYSIDWRATNIWAEEFFAALRIGSTVTTACELADSWTWERVQEEIPDYHTIGYQTDGWYIAGSASATLG